VRTLRCICKVASRLALVTLTAQITSAQVLINEIHYDPDVKTEPAEFIELCNAGTNAVDLDGWYFSDGIEYRFTNRVTIPAGGFVVVAQNPATIQAKYGATALGPWTGTLANEGEKIVLRNAAGQVVDEVDYQLGFPWPIVGDPPGYSIELVNPDFDNDLGGNWRVSVAGNPAQQSQTLIPTGSVWSYFKGFTEASTPATEWRRAEFDDSGWLSGPMPIGYDPTIPMATPLDDMRYSYTTVFFRSTFVVSDVAEISELTLDAMYDDGFKVWINTTNVLNENMAVDEVPFDGVSGPFREDDSYNTLVINSASTFLRPGTNVIAIQAANIGRDNSSDFYLDLRLAATIGPSTRGPTPGRLNSVYATNLPPQIRQVEHRPRQPTSGEIVRLTAKITDPEGVSGATLRYQVVDPGNYIELTDAAYTNNWIALAMNDSGQNGDEFAGDSVYTALIPAAVQTHRRLVRYRISTSDTGARSLTVPYPDDPQPNFAYFVYAGVPAWTGAVRPGAAGTLGQTFTVSSNEMSRLPVFHLLAKQTAVEDSTWFSRYGGDLYRWVGTLVYDGEVYDHVHYRARGGIWRYSMVKNMWKFDFNRGHDFQMRDNWGRKYRTRWTKLNLGASIQQGDYLHRGEQGMFESVGLRLFQMAGLESSHTSFVQFRVVDRATEVDASSQYEGDFWGVYLAVEQMDGRFLDEHNLPDGNLYKYEYGGELNNVGPAGPVDGSDLNAFLTGLNSSSPDSWWRTNWYLPNGYSYQAMVQAFHHFDIGGGKNYFYYRNPLTGFWTVHPWDLDLTWAENMYDAGGYGGEAFKSYALPRTAFNLEYRNRVREVRDLLYNQDEAWRLIDEYAGRLRGSPAASSIIDADRAQWDYNPKMADSQYSDSLGKAGRGRFYQWPEASQANSGVTRDFNGCLRLMKNYVLFRSTNTSAQGGPLDRLSADTLIPSTPSIGYGGATNYPANRLVFQSSAFVGQGGFRSMKWRVGEITRPTEPGWLATDPWKYEIDPVWESEELTAFNPEITIPAGVLKAGHVYRARVRMTDQTGRTSHWSPPVEFVVGEPDTAADLLSYLRLTELMYDPPAGTDAEFIELRNCSTNVTLTLDGAQFTQGIDFVFPAGTALGPGEFLLVVGADPTNDFAAFRQTYALDASVRICGPYAGSLNNDGESLTLKTVAAGTPIIEFAYGDGRGWPVAADGAGHSLVPLDRAQGGQSSGALDYPGNWRASSFIGGSPGLADPAPPSPALVLNEITAHTDYYNPQRPEYDSNDWIELLSRASTNVNLDDWYLSDDPADLRQWALPSTDLAAGARVTFDEISGFHSPITVGFGIDKAGERVLLSYLPGTAADRVVDAVQFKGQENDCSWERYPDGGEFWYPALRSSNAVNLLPAQSVIINEVMYHPPSLDGTNDNVLDEYIEILNPTGSMVSLFNTNGAWRLDGGAGFTFPTNTTIPPGGLLVLVNFDPAGTNLTHFRSLYGLTNPAVPILGPYSGKLGNRSDRLALERRQYPDLPGDPDSWVIVDEVIYGNQNPWLVAANAVGSALQRLAPGESGNDPTNWIAAAPGPGAASVVNPDRDGDGMPNTWEDRYGLNPDDLADAALDSDGDTLTNLQEYLAGTDPRDAASRLQFDSVSAANTIVTLRFHAAADRSYTVQYRDEVHTGPWSKLRDVVAEPSARAMALDDPLPPGVLQRYYRLVLRLNP